MSYAFSMEYNSGRQVEISCYITAMNLGDVSHSATYNESFSFYQLRSFFRFKNNEMEVNYKIEIPSNAFDGDRMNLGEILIMNIKRIFFFKVS